MIGDCGEEFASAAVKALGLPRGKWWEHLPFCCILATVNLSDCREVFRVPLRPQERLFGDYSPGRFAWILEDIKPLKTPMPFRGRQGLFEVPDELFVEETHAKMP